MTAPTTEDNTGLAELVLEKFNEVMSQSKLEKVDAIVDLIEIGQINWVDTQASKKYIEMARNKKIEHIAVCGSNPLIKGIVNFIIKATGKAEKFKWFGKVRDAEKWIKE